MMQTFYDELSEHSPPRATRVVATIVNGVAKETMRDQSDPVCELPPSYTKRKMYSRFLFDHGWTVN
jgi:predicted N-acyltransferase